MRVSRVIAPGARTGRDIELSRSESLHLVRVLRHVPGDQLLVLSGTGEVFAGRIVSVEGEDSPRVTVGVGEVLRHVPAILPWHVAVAPVKGSGMDLAVRVASEVGLAGIIPLVTDRGQVPAARSGRADRWQRISLEAAKQCGRAHPLEIGAAATVAELLERCTGRIYIAEPGADLPTRGELVSEGGPHPATFLIGPEGGFSDAEIALAVDRGARGLGFPTPVMRTPTAVVYVAALSAVIGLDAPADKEHLPKWRR